MATLLNADLASDALQDAFLAGLDRPPLHDTNVAGWLFRVAVRKAARARRRRPAVWESDRQRVRGVDELPAR